MPTCFCGCGELADQITQGAALRESCLAAVHELPGAEPPNRSAAKEWIETAELPVAAARMPLKSRRRFATAVATGSPEEIMSSFEHGKRQT